MSKIDEEREAKLDHLCQCWYSAKMDEEAAKQRKEAIAADIAKIIGCPDHGQKTVKVGKMSVTTKRELSYKCDVKNAMIACGEACFNAKTSWSLNVKEYERLRKDDKAAFRKLSEFVEITQGKPSVSLKV